MAIGIKKNPEDRFMKALEEAMKLAKDIPGVQDVSWKINLTGRKTVVENLTTRINTLTKVAKGLEEEPNKEEIITTSSGDAEEVKKE